MIHTETADVIAAAQPVDRRVEPDQVVTRLARLPGLSCGVMTGSIIDFARNAAGASPA